MELFKLAADYVNWFILGIFLVSAELLIPGVYVIWFGVAALVMGAITFLIPMGLAWQIALFGILSLISTVIGVKVYRKEGQVVKSGVLNTVRGSEYVGLRFKTETPIANGIGRLNIGDSNWTIMGDDCEIGTEIEITGVDLNALRFKIITSDTDGTD